MLELGKLLKRLPRTNFAVMKFIFQHFVRLVNVVWNAGSIFPRKFIRTFATYIRLCVRLFLIWTHPGFFSDFVTAKLFTNSITTNTLMIDWACPHLVDKACLQAPRLIQQWKGVQVRLAPLSIGYLPAGIVTMAPTWRLRLDDCELDFRCSPTNFILLFYSSLT